MSSHRAFPLGVAEKIKFYVYMLLDPRSDPPEPFYIGKGCGNRIFGHLHDALETPTESDKLARIRAILSQGLEVRHVILRHGLEEDQAYELESAFIDYIDTLTNIAGGRARNRGIMTVDEAIAEYEAPDVAVVEPALLFKINKLYRMGMSAQELYDATRKSWTVSRPHAGRARYGCAVAFGIIRQVYRIDEWYPSEDMPERWAFRGQVAHEMQKYVGGSVAKLFKQGAANPFKYLNCS